MRYVWKKVIEKRRNVCIMYTFSPKNFRHICAIFKQTRLALYCCM